MSFYLLSCSFIQPLLERLQRLFRHFSVNWLQIQRGPLACGGLAEGVAAGFQRLASTLASPLTGLPTASVLFQQSGLDLDHNPNLT